MIEKQNEATLNRPEGDRPLDSKQLSIDIPSAIKQILSEVAWQKNDRNSLTLFKSGNISTVLVSLHENAEMHTRQPNDMLMIQVLKGRIKFTSSIKSEDLSEQQLLFFHEGIPYSIIALDQTILLLTVKTEEPVFPR